MIPFDPLTTPQGTIIFSTLNTGSPRLEFENGRIHALHNRKRTCRTPGNGSGRPVLPECHPRTAGQVADPGPGRTQGGNRSQGGSSRKVRLGRKTNSPGSEFPGKLKNVARALNPRRLLGTRLADPLMGTPKRSTAWRQQQLQSRATRWTKSLASGLSCQKLCSLLTPRRNSTAEKGVWSPQEHPSAPLRAHTLMSHTVFPNAVMGVPPHQ